MEFKALNDIRSLLQESIEGRCNLNSARVVPLPHPQPRHHPAFRFRDYRQALTTPWRRAKVRP